MAIEWRNLDACVERHASMLSVVSQTILVVIGLAIFMGSAWGVVTPDKLMKSVRLVLDQKWGIHFGVIVRLVLGAALIIAAPQSSFPSVFEVLGWIAILAALGLVVMGRNNIRKIISWFERLARPVIRLWLLFGIAFGGLLVYGVT